MADLSEDDRALAAELALSLLEGDEATAARRRVGADPDFAAEVARWHEDLAVLTDALEPVRPSAAARRALMTRVFGAPPRRRFLGLGLGAAVALGAAAIVVLTLPEDDVLVAELAPEGREYQVVASFIVGRDTLRLARTGGDAAPAGRATELWAIAPDAAPVSLGLIPEGNAWNVTLPAALLPQAAALTLALSDEPTGGSPTGAPTGAVLAAATLQEQG